MSDASKPLIPLPLGQRVAILVGIFALLIVVASIRGAAPTMKRNYERWEKRS